MKELGMARSAFAASAVAVALALAGCGGGGDSDDRADRADAVVDGLKAQIKTLEGQVSSLTGERDTARGEVSDLEEMIGMMGDAADDAPSASLYAQLNAATEDAASLRRDIGMMADEANAAGSLYAQINYHMGEVRRLEIAAGNADDMPSEAGSLHAQIAYHMEQANDLRMMLGNPGDAAGGTSLHAQLNAANARANGLSDMIGNASDDASTAEGASLHAQLNHYKAEAKRLQETIEQTTDATAVAKAKAVNAALRGADAVAPSVSVAASTAGMVTAKSTGYTDAAEAPDVAGLPSGWRGRMLTKDDDMLVVYSDIKDAEGTALNRLYSFSSVTGQATGYHVHRLDTNSGTTQTDVNGDIHDGSISWAEVERADKTLSTTTEGTTTTTSFKGSIKGVAGTFSCIGTQATCTPATYDDEGELDSTAAAAGLWAFQPDDPNALAAVADEDYVSVGWLLSKDADGTYSYGAFARGHGLVEAAYDVTTNGTAVTGEAFYTGGAAGKYSLLDEIEDEAHGGHWTATAKLTANFDADENEGNTDTTENSGVKLNGSISGFTVDGEENINWKVTLSAMDIDTTDGTGDGQQNPTTFVVTATNASENDLAKATWTRGGAASGTGNWTAIYHGSNTDGAQPGAVTGDFSASVGNRAYIEGAFAAQKDEEE